MRFSERFFPLPKYLFKGVLIVGCAAVFGTDKQTPTPIQEASGFTFSGPSILLVQNSISPSGMLDRNRDSNSVNKINGLEHVNVFIFRE